MEILERAQLAEHAGRYPRQLSGGQQQLVAVARAVIARPKVILADEPTGNLHSSQGKEIMDLFKTLNDRGTTIVQVTHSDVNATYGRRIVKLSDGWIVD
jgi:ABC-type lipoprotein export system ATPase subunit